MRRRHPGVGTTRHWTQPGVIHGEYACLLADITGDSQLRWIGPEKGVIHMATAAVVNAVWDLWAKVEGKPLWKLLSDMTPEQLVSCIDFRYISDVLSPDDALESCCAARPGASAARGRDAARWVPRLYNRRGLVGLRRRADAPAVPRNAGEGLAAFQTEGGPGIGSRSAPRAYHARRDRAGEHPDARCQPGVGGKRSHHAMQSLADFNPLWIEEPTSPDDILGHAAIARAVAPIYVATGEHVQNRIVFKQLFQAKAIGICQIDACRVGGVNEVLAILLMAAHFGIPVCPHAGGVGLCEYVQHLSIFDYIAISGSLENRMIEYTPHLHEHFVHPAIIKDGRYVAPDAPGYSITMYPASIAAYSYPEGSEWANERK